MRSEENRSDEEIAIAIKNSLDAIADFIDEGDFAGLLSYLEFIKKQSDHSGLKLNEILNYPAVVVTTENNRIVSKVSYPFPQYCFEILVGNKEKDNITSYLKQKKMADLLIKNGANPENKVQDLLSEAGKDYANFADYKSIRYDLPLFNGIVERIKMCIDSCEKNDSEKPQEMHEELSTYLQTIRTNDPKTLTKILAMKVEVINQGRKIGDQYPLPHYCLRCGGPQMYENGNEIAKTLIDLMVAHGVETRSTDYRGRNYDEYASKIAGLTVGEAHEKILPPEVGSEMSTTSPVDIPVTSNLTTRRAAPPSAPSRSTSQESTLSESSLGEPFPKSYASGIDELGDEITVEAGAASATPAPKSTPTPTGGSKAGPARPKSIGSSC